MEPRIASLVAQQCLPFAPAACIEARPLRGGLESAVAHVRIRSQGPLTRGLPRHIVVKQLLGTQRREADVYGLLWRTLSDPPAARVLARRDTPEAAYLCLEHVRVASAWPWRDTAAAGAVCQALARVHRARAAAAGLPPWDYEQSLRRSAEDTLRLATVVRYGGDAPWRHLGELKRVVAALPRLRERLLAAGTTLIHGDVHPGNVLLRAGEGPGRVVLIDWAASRVGSPLEDVASWLHSLGCWEPEARRRHDSLVAAYLRSTRPAMPLDAAWRANYWIASASNGLAGAIRYHLAVLGDPASSARDRKSSQRALDEWQRVIRRAADVAGATNPPHAWPRAARC
ncbi:phosphotransferase [Ramlibacter sp. AW1]|uniref:Phosphotransferase n=1 Tax=Ramlibacter aurantiacus TaxID=2801330 RepID=A0A936ZI98_9BURK|nr:phosphotransferase [Ramlibacter aurantiacus]MBL0420733.1 phosphotransferase [Ramlibacter aurantiacus]